MTAVETFARRHDADLVPAHGYYRELIPLDRPGPGQQYGFEVDLDSCTGCKACVTACHSLNGLDDDESWRSVGLLHGGTEAAPFQQTVTTACHHCVDPACLSGCPVDAYEKDPVTGIVSHLDDQCIGCGYCTLTCPYEVPRFNLARGIVRKCDMCKGRLDEGEAPACVQACPNNAIRISIVDTAVLAADAAAGSRVVPGAPPSAITVPTTVYLTTRPEVHELRAADHFALRPAQAHPPLAVMLVLTQLAVGAVATDLVVGASAGRANAVVAAVMGILAMGASVLHLGRPRYAFRAVIGVRHSWLSREIVAFTVFSGLTVLSAFTGMPFALRVAAAASGIVGVACSVMIYAVTHRTWWRVRVTGTKFVLTTAVCGLATTLATAAVGGEPVDGVTRPLALALVVAVVLKLACEAAVLRHLRGRRDSDLARTARLLTGELGQATWWRVALGVGGGLLLPLVVAVDGAAWPAVLAVLVVVAGELIERSQFFRAVTAPRMPGSP